MGVTGIGGVFFRAKDPVALTGWYEKHLGINGIKWEQQAGPTAFAAFPAATDYFGSKSQQFMLNLRVDDLEGLLSQLKADGVKVAKEADTHTGLGSFASIEDPEGNRIELWQPE